MPRGSTFPKATSGPCRKDSGFLLTYLNLTYAAGNPTGSGKVRQTTKLDGNRYSGSGDFSYYELNGNVVASGTFTITAKKIRVEAAKQ
jgi:hypothetical protein